MESDLIQHVRTFVKQILETLPPHITYHNFSHTAQVANSVKEIGSSCGIPEKELEMIIIAAWFHDTGYLMGRKDHETESSKIAEEYLTSQRLDPVRISQVKNAIAATRMPQSPKNLLEEILCDADLYYLSTVQFEMHADRLRKELDTDRPVPFTDQEWGTSNLRFLKSHHYFTTYGQRVLQEGKIQTMNRIIKV